MKTSEALRLDLTLAPEIAEREVIKHARRLTSLQARRRRLMKAIRDLEDEIRTAKRTLRAVVADVTGRDATIELVPPEEPDAAPGEALALGDDPRRI